jgi:2Fe-2S ferredoxin
MPMIHFKKGRRSLEVPVGSNLMQALLREGIPVASSCRGDGVCAKCRIEILEGSQNLSRVSEQEARIKQRLDIPASERLSCQTEVLGDITIDATYW